MTMTPDQSIRLMLGDLLVTQIVLQAKIAELEKKIAAVEKESGTHGSDKPNEG